MAPHDKRPPDEIDAYLERFDAAFAEKHPGLVRPKVAKTQPYRPGEKHFVLGAATGSDTPVLFPERLAVQHVHMLGAPGSGKTTAIEGYAQQAIQNGRGILLIDPHGGHKDSLYRRMLAWIAKKRVHERRTVHIIDPNVLSHVAGFNPLSVPDGTAVSVIARTALDAVARVWKQDMHATPTIQSVLLATFTALAEHGLTLREANLVIRSETARLYAITGLKSEFARTELENLDELATNMRMPREFKAEIRGPTNRLNDFLANDAVAAILGQTTKCLDLVEAMDNNHIVLVNLEVGRQTDDQAARILGALLFRYLLFYCTRRKKPEVPFYVFVDECHTVLSGDLARLLPEARKFGVGFFLAHQFLHQLRDIGDDIYEAVRAAANTKLVFKLSKHDEAEDVAREVIPLDFETPKPSMVRPIVVDEELVHLYGAQRSTSRSTARSRAETRTSTIAESTAQGAGDSTASSAVLSQMLSPDIGWFVTPVLLGQSAGTGLVTGSNKYSVSGVVRGAGHAVSDGEAIGESSSDGTSIREAYKAIRKDMPTVLFSKEELLYTAATTLRRLKPGHMFASFEDKAASVTTFKLPRLELSDPEFEQHANQILASSPFAKPADEANAEIRARQAMMQPEPPKSPDGGPAGDDPTRDYDFGAPEPVPPRPPRGTKPRLVKG